MAHIWLDRSPGSAAVRRRPHESIYEFFGNPLKNAEREKKAQQAKRAHLTADWFQRATTTPGAAMARVISHPRSRGGLQLQFRR